MSALSASIDEICAPWDREGSPGCVVAVLRDGELLHSRGYGMADLERGVPLSPGSVLDIGSVSKQFTAMCVALLAQQRKLSLDDDIRDYLPEMPWYGAPITIRHLVHHTSGVREYLDLLALAGRRHLGASAAEVLALLQRQRGINFAPGDEFQYSNSGYVLLAAIVGRAAGCSLQDYAAAALFQPLGMSDTSFVEGGRQGGGRMALAYAPLEGGSFTVDAAGINLAGDAALLTTAEDLCRWELGFYDARLGGPDLMRQAVAPSRLNDGEALSYAFGLFLGKLGPHPIVRHGGNFAGYEAEVLRCPEQKLSVLCLANLGTFDARGVARRIAALCLGEELRPPKAPAAARLEGWTGPFRDTASGRIWQLSAADGGLRASSSPVSVSLVPVDADHLLAQEPHAMTLTRERPEDGGAARLVLKEEGRAPRRLEPVQLAVPAAEELDEYAGVYACDELDVIHEFRHRARQLLVQMPAIPFPLPLTPTVRDEFTIQGAMVRFLRDPARRISGFTLGSTGVKELRFELSNRIEEGVGEQALEVAQGPDP
jgi:CubicO group peptidase (beta-lactamase class C family)